MRTCTDAKAMATSLRDSLATRSVLLSRSECLEIVAKQFGFADWNTLAAKADAKASHLPGPGVSERTPQAAVSPGARPVPRTVAASVAFCAQINADTER